MDKLAYVKILLSKKTKKPTTHVVSWMNLKVIVTHKNNKNIQKIQRHPSIYCKRK